LQDHGKALAFQKPGLTRLLNRALLFYPLIAPLRYQKLLQKTCSHCKTRLKDFFQTARLGCSHCFVEFEEVLVPLYEQIIRDSEANKNRRASEIQWGLRQLRQRLTEALEKEDYKEAAQLRDLLAQEEARHDGFFGQA